jgi:hypothetical protein
MLDVPPHDVYAPSKAPAQVLLTIGTRGLVNAVYTLYIRSLFAGNVWSTTAYTCHQIAGTGR